MDIIAYVLPSIVTIAVCLAYVNLRKYLNRRKTRKEDTADDGEAIGTARSSRSLMEEALRKINVEYKIKEDNPERILLKYQGENFFVDIPDDCTVLTIFDPFWMEARLDDLENLSLQKRAINECNLSYKGAIVYTTDKEERKIYIHSKYDIVCTDGNAHFELYIRHCLDALLAMQKAFFRKMESLRAEDMKL